MKNKTKKLSFEQSLKRLQDEISRSSEEAICRAFGMNPSGDPKQTKASK